MKLCLVHSRWFIPLAFGFLTLGEFGVSSKAFGTESFEETELALLNAEVETQSRVEGAIVAHLRDYPGSARAHYLYTLWLLWQYRLDPSRLDDIAQAMTLTRQIRGLEAANPRAPPLWGPLAEIELLGLAGKISAAWTMANSSPSARSSWRMIFNRSRLSFAMGLKAEATSLIPTILKLLVEGSDSVSPSRIEPFEEFIAGYGIELVGQLPPSRRLPILDDWKRQFPNILWFHEAYAREIMESEPARARKLLELVVAKTQSTNPLGEVARYELALLVRDKYADFTTSRRLLDELIQNHTSEASSPVSSHKKQVLSLCYLQRGALRLAQKEDEEALSDLTQGLLLSEEHESALTFNIESLRRFGHGRKLLELVGRWAELLPGQAIFHRARAEILTEIYQDDRRATHALADAILLDPKNPTYFSSLGLTWLRLRAYPQAVTAFARAVALNPLDPLGHYNKACALARAGAKRQAVASLTLAFTLDPSLKTKAVSDPDLDNLHDEALFQKLVGADLPKKST